MLTFLNPRDGLRGVPVHAKGALGGTGTVLEAFDQLLGELRPVFPRPPRRGGVAGELIGSVGLFAGLDVDPVETVIAGLDPHNRQHQRLLPTKKGLFVLSAHGVQHLLDWITVVMVGVREDANPLHERDRLDGDHEPRVGHERMCRGLGDPHILIDVVELIPEGEFHVRHDDVRDPRSPPGFVAAEGVPRAFQDLQSLLRRPANPDVVALLAQGVDGLVDVVGGVFDNQNFLHGLVCQLLQLAAFCWGVAR